MSKLETNQVDPATGTTLTLGTSGDTIAIPSGVTIANSGTATGFAGRVLIKEIDASDVAAVTFVNGTSDVIFDTTYDTYELRWSNVLVAGDEQLNLRALSGGSVLTSGYYQNDYGAVDGSASVTGSTTCLLETHGDADTAEPFFGVAWLTNVGVSASKPCAYGQYFHERSTGVHASKTFSGVYDTAISDFDGVTITNLGGPNIASGKFKLYGLN
jgi:hypothetical protein